MHEFELAGDHMTMTEDEDGTATFTFDDKGTGRRCGDCQLCCKLVPVPAIRKPAGERCVHARHHKGCTIYPARPFDCRSWSCRWLSDSTTAGLPRPDRAHYVIDPAYDYVSTVYDDGRTATIGVLQIWVDPAFPDAHRAPDLRAYMLHMAEKYHVATIVRYSSTKALTIGPPPLARDGKWHEIDNGVIVARNHTEAEILANVPAARR